MLQQLRRARSAGGSRPQTSDASRTGSTWIEHRTSSTLVEQRHTGQQPTTKPASGQLQLHVASREAVLKLLEVYPDDDVTSTLAARGWDEAQGQEICRWVEEVSLSADCRVKFAQLRMAMPEAGWGLLWSAAGSPPPPFLLTPTVPLAVRAIGRRVGACVHTGLHGGNLELLRLCVSSLPDWQEECSNAAASRRACDIVWVDACSRIRPGMLWAGQMVSCLDGVRELSDKVETELAIRRCRCLGLPGFGGAASPFPQTWVLPEEILELHAHVRAERQRAVRLGRPLPTYIIKPAGGSEGAGIFLVQHEGNLPRTPKRTVAQAYVEPMLHSGKKFDLRCYMLVRVAPDGETGPRDVRFEAYLHREGLARFCTELYQQPRAANLHETFAHLTNYSLNKQSDKFVRVAASASTEHDDDGQPTTPRGLPGARDGGASTSGSDSEDSGDDDSDSDGWHGSLDDHGGAPSAASGCAADASGARRGYVGCSKRPASVVIRELARAGLVDEFTLWQRIEHCAELTAAALEPSLALQYHAAWRTAQPRQEQRAKQPSGPVGEPCLWRSGFHLIGIDVIIDRQGLPRLLEINSAPSLSVRDEGPSAAGKLGGGAPPVPPPPSLAFSRLPAPSPTLSPVDCEVKQRVLCDVLQLLGDLSRSGAISALLGDLSARPLSAISAISAISATSLARVRTSPRRTRAGCASCIAAAGGPRRPSNCSARRAASMNRLPSRTPLGGCPRASSYGSPPQPAWSKR